MFARRISLSNLKRTHLQEQEERWTSEPEKDRKHKEIDAQKPRNDEN